MAHGDARERKWRGNWRTEWVASTLHTISEHGVSSITTADAHTSAASSRLNWRPRRRFKWTRPFRRKTKSGFCACAITFQLASTSYRSLVSSCCGVQCTTYIYCYDSSTTREQLQKSKWNMLKLHNVNSYDNLLACRHPRPLFLFKKLYRSQFFSGRSSSSVLVGCTNHGGQLRCVVGCRSGRCGVGEVQWVDIVAREQATVLTCVPCDVICAAAHTPWLLFTSRCIFKVDVCGFRSPAGFGPKRGFDFLCGRQTRIVHPVFPSSQGETVNSDGQR